jgi:NAD-dependent SIR2 family protein deacetylase
MILVVGTSAQVYPAAGFIAKARRRGARVVVVDPRAREDDETYGLQEGDFAFADDAATMLPKLLEPLIGKIEQPGPSPH